MTKSGSYKGRSRSAILALFGFVLTLSYNNCSEHTGYRTLSQQELALCSNELQDLYKNTYYGFLARESTCKSCHNDAGQSPFKFASEDLDRAFGTFSQLGHTALYAKAIDPTHAKPFTGPQNQVAFDTLGTFWQKGELEHSACVTSQNYFDPGIRTVGKIPAVIYYSSSNAATETITWDLSQRSDMPPGQALMNLVISLDISILYSNATPPVPIGYKVDNLTFTPKSGTSRISLDGFYLFVNDTLIPDLAEFANISESITGIDPVAGVSSSNAQGFQAQIPSISNRDAISLYIRSASELPRLDLPPEPARPIPVQASLRVNENRITNLGVQIQRDPSVRKMCVTPSALPPISTEVPCPSQDGITLSNQAIQAGLSVSQGWINIPATYTQNPTFPFNVGSAFQLGASENGNVPRQAYIWVANADLAINRSNPATVTILYDNVGPQISSLMLDLAGATGGSLSVAPRLGSLQNLESGMQYCLQSVAADTPALNTSANGFEPDGSCWQNSLPSNFVVPNSNPGIGIFVALFTRDAAQNLSFVQVGNNRQNIRTRQVGNQSFVEGYNSGASDSGFNIYYIPHITFAELKGGGARNAFAKLASQCPSCTAFNSCTVNFATASGSGCLNTIRSSALNTGFASGVLNQMDRNLIVNWCNNPLQ